MHFLKTVLYLLVCQISFSQTTSFIAYEQSLPGSSLKINMLPIKAGSFLMGSPLNEKGRSEDEGPQKTFSISAFWMGAYEITHDEFDLFFKDASISQDSETDAITRPSPQYIDLSWNMGRDGGFPVNSMQQKTALMFCQWLYKKTGIFYRLPTEAEWEYACRAGSKTKYFFGNDEKELEKYAWYKKNSKNIYHKKGQLLPNAWGLYDMLGNVAEWVLDQYDENYFSKMNKMDTDPELKPTSRNPRILKGGSYTDEAIELRIANRTKSLAEWNRRDPQIPKSPWWLTDAPFAGFRIARPLKQPSFDEIETFFKLYLSY
jgi:formylglycine-generating enzyme required for sulfatase activity